MCFTQMFLETLTSSFNLAGNIAVVTGAGKGIGYAVAKGLAQVGANIVAISRTGSDLALLSNEIEHIGRRILTIRCDISSLDQIEKAVELSIQEFGGVDILVNNAGIVKFQSAESVDEKTWDETMGTNLKGLFFCAQKFGKVMIQKRKGKIINVSSILAFTAIENHVVYCASKGGVTMITKSLAVEWGKYGINVNAVAPSFIRTPLSAPNLDNPEMRGWILERCPIGRVGKPEDVVGAVIYLASPASHFVTGETLMVDGGWVAL
jgi:NAD(P)-dependent dehydrogenase (short-subunit alcohol dehydrogenase family)